MQSILVDYEDTFKFIESNKCIIDVLNAIPEFSLIMDYNARIIYANKSYQDARNVKEINNFVGKYFGEFLLCENSINEYGGCGHKPNVCKYCKALSSITGVIKDNTTYTGEDSFIIQNNGDEFIVENYKITASPLLLNDTKYIFIILKDITDSKELMGIQRVFFHDLMNKIFIIKTSIYSLLNIQSVSPTSFLQILEKSIDSLIEDIQVYRHLYINKLEFEEIQSHTINVKEFFENLLIVMQTSPVYNKYLFDIDIPNEINLNTKKVFFERVVTNMVKNAVEADNNLKIIKIKVAKENNTICFSVHNSAYIPLKIQSHLFKPFFSTKGNNRGVGTYSMKKLAKSFLNGDISYISSKIDGTTMKLIIKNPIEFKK